MTNRHLFVPLITGYSTIPYYHHGIFKSRRFLRLISSARSKIQKIRQALPVLFVLVEMAGVAPFVHYVHSLSRRGNDQSTGLLTDTYSTTHTLRCRFLPVQLPMLDVIQIGQANTCPICMSMTNKKERLFKPKKVQVSTGAIQRSYKSEIISIRTYELLTKKTPI